MAWTQAQVDALRDAIATGATRVTYEGRTIEYRSLDEMRRLLAEMEAVVSGATGRTTHINPEFVRE